MENLYGLSFTWDTLPKGYTATLFPLSEEEHVYRVGVHFDLGEKKIPEPVTLSFRMPTCDLLSVWYPLIGQNRKARGISADWLPVSFESRLTGGDPTLALIGHDEKNRLTLTVDDVRTPIRMTAGIVEETAEVKITVTFFYRAPGYLSSYDTALRLDFRPLPYAEALMAAEEHQRKINGLTVAHVPEEATYPMYSTWYSYHQAFVADEVIAECRAAAKMGMRAVIVDDGWQTDDASRGYAYCGDWKMCEKKIPDIHRFVEEVHECGMKVIFWFSVPFVGKHAALYSRFADMILGDPDDAWGTLDPRFPEVREFLLAKYVEAVKDWGFDGLKLDFVDSFLLTSFSAKDDPRMDYVDLYAACDRLLNDVCQTLTAINPEILLEFRQSYIGPAMQTYGNMFRVGDCPNDALINRTSAVDMRLVMHKSAIHSDMLMWNKKDSVESAARQLLNIFFTVPQISVRFAEMPKSQSRMLAHYLKVWEENRTLLLYGDFRAEGVSGAYTRLTVENGEGIFVLDYAKGVCEVKDARPLRYLNITAGEEVYLRLPTQRQVRILNAEGDIKEEIRLDAGVHPVKVPSSGMMEVL